MNKMKMLTTFALSAGTLIIFAASASAAITTLRLDDSQGGFTTSTTPALNTANGAGDNDGEWGFTSTNAIALLGDDLPETTNLSGYAWVARVDLGEDVPLLTTTVSGLNSSLTYNIYGYHATSSVNDWSVRIGLNGGGLTEYYIGDGDVLDTDSTSNLERISLGQISGSTSFTIEWSETTNTINTPRTFLKGMGIEAVPEASTALLVGATGLCLLLRRRR